MATKRAGATTTTAAPVKKAAAASKSPAKKAPAAKAPAASKSAPTKAAAAKKAPAAAKAAGAKKAPATKAPAQNATPARSATPVKKAPVKNAESASPLSAKASAPSKAPVKKALSKKSPFDKAFLDSQVKLLNEERATLLTQAVALKAEADALALDREPGDVQFDDESGEGDTLAVERDFDLARAAAAMHTVDEIDAALERVKKGTYGICEYSGEPIPKERLEAIPYARERVEYKTRSFR
jgi:RNA polymerase-binding transcription factor DksA